ncbi:hypothetical protein [Sinorhizobium medicae]|uniref:hypothetical protein n=1 Tax=Sinorhizobium medicae TaxID=110321 RepID=UPI000FD7137A|nr:hypothetical protein [Sinorhizobium medicae]RVJ77346.1 hypothetical protein CN168_19565 [Sinorhizobium medicae]
MTRQPLLSLERYEIDHFEFDRDFHAHVLTAWGEGQVKPDILWRMQRRSACLGFAVNMDARIAHARSAAANLERLIRNEPELTFFRIDLVCRDHIVSLSDAVDFDVKRVKRWARRQLPGVNFLGGVDAALYYAGQLLPGQTPPFISWHAHVIAWGVTEEHLFDLQAETNASFAAGWHGATAFHFEALPQEKVVGRAMYAIKAPMSEYSVSAYEPVDNETGEVGNLRYIQEKRKLRPHRRIEIAEVLDERLISDVLFAGGSGKAIRCAILAKTGWLLMGEHSRSRRQRREVFGLDPNTPPYF